MQIPHVESLDQGSWHQKLNVSRIGNVSKWLVLGLVATACGVAGDVQGDGTLEGASSSDVPNDGDETDPNGNDDANEDSNGDDNNATSPNDTDGSDAQSDDASDDVGVDPGGSGGSVSPVTPTSSGGGTTEVPSQTPPTFACDESARPPVATLRRLTMKEYSNTVRDLAVWATGDNGAANLVTDVLNALPQDEREPVPQDVHGSYRRLDQTLQQVHVDTLYDAGVRVGALLTQENYLAAVVGECATDGNGSNDATCLDTFITSFGNRALRRPVTEEEVTFYHSVYGDSTTADPAAYADVIAVMLNAPDFVYFVEHGAAEVGGQAGVFELSATELASRLSYQIWQTAPDDELLAAAADNSLLDPNVYQTQVTRLLADARARDAASEFVEDWLKVEDLPALDANTNDAVFRAFADGIEPNEGLRQGMIDDVVSMVNHYIWTEPSGLDALFTSDLSFAQNATLASIYGVSPWDGTSEPVTLPNGERPGVFTRALFLSTGTANTRPVMKGVFLRRQVLCDVIPAPPAGANTTLPEFRENMTTRELVEEITEVPGSTCAGCHENFINPLGFATEGFDSLGRVRQDQKLFDELGEFVEAKPVDTQVTPRVNLSDETTITTPSELMQLLVDSGKIESCFARNYFRFTFARWEDDALDGCALDSVRKELADGGSITDAMKAIVLSPAFKHRAFE
jgi:hypothetical protein